VGRGEGLEAFHLGRSPSKILAKDLLFYADVSSFSRLLAHGTGFPTLEINKNALFEVKEGQEGVHDSVVRARLVTD
jgi:hypothetical protein